jgi:hypothetical protein
MVVEKLCEFLHSLLPTDVQSVAVVGELPSVTAEGLAIHIAGQSSNSQFFRCDDAVSILYKPMVRFFIRTRDYQLGTEWGELIRNLYHKYVGPDEHRTLEMQIVGAQIYLGKNPEGLYEFQTTFTTQIRSE